MTTDFQIAAPEDTLFQKPALSAGFNNVADISTLPPLPNADLTQSGISLSAQVNASFQPSLAPEPVKQETAVHFEGLQGCVEDATYSLATMQMAGGSWLTDSMNMAMTTMTATPEINAQVNPTPVAPEPTMQATWTPQAPAPGLAYHA